MPERTDTTHEESQHEFGPRFFAVGTDPYCVWDWDLRERNLEYLKSLDPDYFDYVGRANLPHLDAEDPSERRRAATAIRTAYHHGLESFFALLFATVQAPWCVVGWMQVYSPASLREMVRAADPGLSGKGAQRRQTHAFREKLLPYVWVKPRSFLRWEGLSKTIHRLDHDKEEVGRIQELFGSLWHKFAKDFVNDTFVSEYNSIKHGLRTGSGGFYMLIGPEAIPGEPPPAEAMHSLGSSEHGSSFFTPRTFVNHLAEKDKRARPGHGRNREFHFRMRRQAINWEPKGLCDALTLISASIHNVRSFVQWVNGVDSSGLRFAIPDETVFSGPLGRPQGIAATNMDGVVLKSDVRLFGREELEAEIEEGLRRLRERLDPPTSPDASRSSS